MRKYRKATTLTSRGVYLRKRISRNRGRAKLVGFIYLLAIIALAAAACFPLLVHDLAPVGVTKFYKAFMPANLKGFSMADKDKLITLINCGLYALMLLGVFVNVLKGLGKLGWLFKKRGSKAYGFNRNVYAMDDLGNIFSGSLTVIMVTYVFIALLCGSRAINLLMLIVLGGGVFIRLFAGFLGAKVGYYDLERGEILEQRRIVGRFSPLLRNVFQFAAIGGILYFLDFAALNETIVAAMSKSGVTSLIKDMKTLIPFAAQVVAILCLFVLIKHATGTAEYGIDGAHGPGMKTFKVFTFFMFLALGGAVAYKYFLAGKVFDTKLAILAGIAFASFFIELIMCKLPRFPKDKRIVDEDDEFTLESLPQPKPQENV